MRGAERGGRDGGWPYVNRWEESKSVGDRKWREQGGWNLVQSKRLQKLDIASKYKMDEEERKNLVSFFFTYFSDSLKAWDMFRLFSIHGRVVPGLKEGRRKRFGFARFRDVKDPELMAIKLDNVFVRGIKLHVNLPKFNRDQRMDEVSKKEVT